MLLRWEMQSIYEHEAGSRGLLELALADGWEPYAVTATGSAARTFHLRRRVEAT